MMKLMLRLMKMLPKWISDRMNPPIVAKHRLKRWRSNPAGIAMNLTNLLICSDYCIPCPSHSGKRGDGVYCATGKVISPLKKGAVIVLVVLSLSNVGEKVKQLIFVFMAPVLIRLEKGSFVFKLD